MFLLKNDADLDYQAHYDEWSRFLNWSFAADKENDDELHNILTDSLVKDDGSEGLCLTTEMAAQHISYCYSLHCKFFHSKELSSYKETIFHQAVHEHHGVYRLPGDRHTSTTERIITCDDSLRILRRLADWAKYRANLCVHYASAPGSPPRSDLTSPDQQTTWTTDISPSMKGNLCCGESNTGTLAKYDSDVNCSIIFTSYCS
jgi:hypothetical protein